MKKIFTSLLVCMMVLSMSLSNLFALNVDLVKKSYDLIKSYYTSQEKLDVDDVISYESLELESDDLELNEESINLSSVGGLSKTIIALTLHGDDPRHYNGENLVEKLENTIHEDGASYVGNYASEANQQVYVVFALYVANSQQTEKATDYLKGLIQDDGSFGYTDWDGSFNHDPQTTGWVIEALSLVNKTKYRDTINKSIEFLASQQGDEGNYTSTYSTGDPNTQAVPLMGLLTYDIEGVKSGNYDKNGHNPLDYILNFQNDNGSFYYPGDPSWGPTFGEGNVNPMATQQAAQVLGYYMNGNVYEKAKNQYTQLPDSIELDVKEKTLSQGDTLQLNAKLNPEGVNSILTWSVDDNHIATIDNNGKVTALEVGKTVIRVKTKTGLEAICNITVKQAPKTEDKPNVDESEIKEVQDDEKVKVEKEETVNKTTQPAQTEETTTQNTKVVQTDDNNNIIELMALTIISAAVFVSIKKKNEKAC